MTVTATLKAESRGKIRVEDTAANLIMAGMMGVVEVDRDAHSMIFRNRTKEGAAEIVSALKSVQGFDGRLSFEFKYFC